MLLELADGERARGDLGVEFEQLVEQTLVGLLELGAQLLLTEALDVPGAAVVLPVLGVAQPLGALGGQQVALVLHLAEMLEQRRLLLQLARALALQRVGTLDGIGEALAQHERLALELYDLALGLGGGGALLLELLLVLHANAIDLDALGGTLRQPSLELEELLLDLPLLLEPTLLDLVSALGAIASIRAARNGDHVDVGGGCRGGGGSGGSGGSGVR